MPREIPPTSNSIRSTTFRWLHAVWAAIGAVACTLLALAKGHPPGLVFVPFAAAAWVLGHGALWLIHRLVDRSERAVREERAVAAKWPPFLILLAFSCGVVFFAGFLVMVGKLVFGGLDRTELAILLSVWVPPSVCFMGILLRKNWARILACAGFFAMAGFLIFEVTYSAMRGRPQPMSDWIIASVVVSLLIFLGLFVLRSRAIRAFFGRP